MTPGLLWRRLRGMLGTSIMWAGAWALAGLLVGGAFWLSGASVFALAGPRWLRAWAEIGAVTGAVSGAAYSLVVMAAERRGDFRAITPLRFGALGAVTGGVVTALIFGQSLPFGLIGAAIGLVSGGGSVIVARRTLPAPRSMVRPLPPAA